MERSSSTRIWNRNNRQIEQPAHCKSPCNQFQSGVPNVEADPQPIWIDLSFNMELKGQVTWTGDLAHSVGAHNRIFQYDSIQDHRVAESFPNMLPEDLWVVLRQIGKMRNYAKGALLFSAEEAPKRVYLIDKGAVGISWPSPARKKVLEQTVGSGALLGLSESITGEDHRFTAEALEDSRTWFVERQDFLKFLRQNQALCLRIVRLLSEDLHQLYHNFQCNSRATARRGRRKL